MAAVGLLFRLSADICGPPGSVEQFSGCVFGACLALRFAKKAMTISTADTTPKEVHSAIATTSRRDGGVSGSSSGARPRQTHTYTTRYCATSTALESVRSVLCRNSVLAVSLALLHRLMSQLQSPIKAAAATAWVKPAFAQVTNVSVIPALPVAVCVCKSIAQGVAGTSLTRCFGFHAASFVSSGNGRNVLFSGART